MPRHALPFCILSLILGIHAVFAAGSYPACKFPRCAATAITPVPASSFVTPETTLRLLLIGDSKTASGKPEQYLGVVFGGKGYYCLQWVDATGGWTVANHQAAIDGWLAGRDANPQYVLINLGANDVAAMPTEATWKANYLYVIDALHAKFPTASVYLMRSWRRNYGANSDTLATWIGDIVTARSDFVYLGPDERVFLENGDNGVTYTSDGIHPNDAGDLLSAQQWATAMGY